MNSLLSKIDELQTSNLMEDAFEYWIDSAQRLLLFTDTLRKQGNIYQKYLEKGQPPIPDFEYEIIIDGRTFKSPVNYKLVRIIPPDSITINLNLRPVIIIDPRTWHDPEIRGSKRDVAINRAMKAGHFVYFILFDIEPVPGQSTSDVKKAKTRFIEEVAIRHPEAEKPLIIGNCRICTKDGIKKRNDREEILRCLLGLSGGSWTASLLSDLGNGRFDSAHLMYVRELFEFQNSFLARLYKIYSTVDTYEEYYPDCKKLQRDLFYMTKDEIRFIFDNLLDGNQPAMDDDTDNTDDTDDTQGEKEDGNMILGEEYMDMFKEREVDKGKAANDKRTNDKNWGFMKAVSEHNDNIYETFISPWVRMMTNDYSARMHKNLHPIRISAGIFSDINPFLKHAAPFIRFIKEDRYMVSEDNFFKKTEKNIFQGIIDALNELHNLQNQAFSFQFDATYGTKKNLEEHSLADREHWMNLMDKGGFVEGVVRLFVAIIHADKSLDRDEFTKVQQVRLKHHYSNNLATSEILRIVKEQNNILQTDEDLAIKALPKLLSTKKHRMDAAGIIRTIFDDNSIAEGTSRLIQKIKDWGEK